MEFAYSVLEKEKKQSFSAVDTVEKDQRDERDVSDGMLFCANCGHPVTSKDNKIEVSGSAEHTFANPAGHVFHIGCFVSAPGCITGLHETGEFTWFPGYSWAMSVCSLCGIHLGWRFRGENDAFFGLILAGLVEKGPASD